MSVQASEANRILADSFATYTHPFATPSIPGIKRQVIHTTPQPASVTVNNTGSSPQNIVVTLPTQMRGIGYTLVQATIACTQSGGTYCRLKQGAPWMGQVQFQVGGQQIYNNLSESRTQCMEFIANQNPLTETSEGVGCLGYGSPSTRNLFGPGRDYYQPLDCGGLFKSLFPYNLLNGTVTYVITPASAGSVVASDGTSYGYTISTMTFVTWYIDEPYQIRDQLRGLLQAQGSIGIPFDYKNIEVGAIQANNTSYSYQIVQRSKSISRTVHWLTVQSQEGDPTVDDFYQQYPNSSITSWQYLAKGIPVPLQPLSSSGAGTESLRELFYAYNNLQGTDSDNPYMTTGVKFMGTEYTGAGTPSGFGSGTKFIMAYRWDSPLYNPHSAIPLLGSGLNTAEANSTVSITLQKGAVNTVYNFYTLTYSDAVLQIMPGGACTLLL